MSALKRKFNPFALIFSIFAALMLTMSFADPTADIEYQNVFSSIFDNLRRSFSGSGIVSTLLFALFYYIGIRDYSEKLSHKKTIGIFSAVIAVCWLMGASFYVNNTLHPIAGSPGQIVKSIIYLCGSFYIIYELSALFNHLLETHSYPSGFSCSFITSHSKITITAGLLLFWAFPVITSYPANMCPDSWTQLTQYWGYMTFYADNPPVHTVILGLFTRLGTVMGNPDIGLFILIIIQAVAFAAVISYSFELMDSLQSPSWLKIITFFTAALSPYYVSYVAMILKDVPYSISILLFVIELIFAIIDFDAFLSNRKHIILSFVSTLGILLFRNNGIYVVYPLFFIIIIILIAKHKLLTKKQLVKSFLIIIISVVIAFAVKTSIIMLCDIESGSIKESLSFPYQQTARTVKEHSDEITEEEITVIDKVLVYDDLAEKYLPTISDPVKALMRKDATTKDLVDYLKTWIKMFFKYPRSYITATANQNYVLVFPFQKLDTFYISYSLNEERHLPLAEYPGFTGSSAFESEKEFLSVWYRFLFYAPIIGILSHPAFYILILFITLLLAICKKKWKYLLASLPVFFSGFGMIFAPCLIGHPRYTFPVIYSLPVILAYYIYAINNH